MLYSKPEAHPKMLGLPCPLLVMVTYYVLNNNCLVAGATLYILVKSLTYLEYIVLSNKSALE